MANLCSRCGRDPQFKHELCRYCWADIFGPAWDEIHSRAEAWDDVRLVIKKAWPSYIDSPASFEICATIGHGVLRVENEYLEANPSND